MACGKGQRPTLHCAVSQGLGEWLCGQASHSGVLMALSSTLARHPTTLRLPQVAAPCLARTTITQLHPFLLTASPTGTPQPSICQSVNGPPHTQVVFCSVLLADLNPPPACLAPCRCT